MKYVIVGSSHFGYEAIQTILKQEPEAEVHLYEADRKASFMGWGSQSYLEGISKSLDELHFANNQSYTNQGVHLHTDSPVIALDPDTKTITIDGPNGKETQSYDKLLLSPGGYAPVPNFEGKDLENVCTFRGRGDTEFVKKGMATTTKAVVIGAGYIGVEVATAFAEAGIDVTVIDRVDRILPTYLAPEIASLLEEHAQEKGLKFAGGEAVVKLTGKDGKVNGVVTDKAEYEADMVVIAVGVRPGTAWLKGALDIDEDGFILTNDHMETSAEDVYAGGDATYITYAPTGTKENIGLATLARRQGIVAALNATGKPYQMPSVSGTSALRFFDYTITTTGLNSMNKDRYQGNVAEAYVKEKVYPDFMRKPGSVHMKLFYDADTHVILGAQLVSKIDIADSINTLSIAIQSKYTLQDLALVDFFYQPNYDRPWHYLNVLAIEALNNTVGGADKLLF